MCLNYIISPPPPSIQLPASMGILALHLVSLMEYIPISILNQLCCLYIGEDDLVDVMEEVVDLASCWKNFGLALRLKLSHLNTIASKNHDPKDCLRDTLQAWLQGCYDVDRFGLPSWQFLWTAVENPVCGNKSLAKKIKERHS